MIYSPNSHNIYLDRIKMVLNQQILESLVQLRRYLLTELARAVSVDGRTQQSNLIFQRIKALEHHLYQYTLEINQKVDKSVQTDEIIRISTGIQVNTEILSESTIAIHTADHAIKIEGEFSRGSSTYSSSEEESDVIVNHKIVPYILTRRKQYFMKVISNVNI